MASDLKAVAGRVIVRVDMQVKNWHTFDHGQTIRHERGPNNLNYRETQPVQGEVLDSSAIPVGSTILFQHNACHDYYRIFNYKKVSGLDIASEVRYFSIPDSACYLYRLPGEQEWIPVKGITTGLRVFEPHTGLIIGIPPKQIKDVLYITRGHLAGQVVHTVRAADYEIVFLGDDGKEANLIRCRHWENPDDDIGRREEIIVVNDWLTEKVHSGEVWVGLTPADAKAHLSWKRTAEDLFKFAERLELNWTATRLDSYDQAKLNMCFDDEPGMYRISEP